MAKTYSDKEIRPHCLQNVDVAPQLTAAVAGDRAVIATTLELDEVPKAWGVLVFNNVGISTMDEGEDCGPSWPLLQAALLVEI